jgi:hypothetical protein
VNCPDNIEMTSYPGVFSQIMTNLLINTLTHGFEHQQQGAITIDIRPEDDIVRLEFQDNGRGMSAEECSRAFDAFYTTKRGQGGTGLGLHIVYNLMTQKLGGQISYESTPGEGTTFILHIPFFPKQNEHHLQGGGGMKSMEIKGDKYRIAYDPETVTITCEGSLRLYGADGFLTLSAFEQNRMAQGTSSSPPSTAGEGYASIMELLSNVAEQKPPKIILDLRHLESMNSSGINVFSKFVIKVREHQTIQLVVYGNESLTWQQKVLKNFRKLLPSLLLEWKP